MGTGTDTARRNPHDPVPVLLMAGWHPAGSVPGPHAVTGPCRVPCAPGTILPKERVMPSGKESRHLALGLPSRHKDTKRLVGGSPGLPLGSGAVRATWGWGQPLGCHRDPRWGTPFPTPYPQPSPMAGVTLCSHSSSRRGAPSPLPAPPEIAQSSLIPMQLSLAPNSLLPPRSGGSAAMGSPQSQNRAVPCACHAPRGPARGCWRQWLRWRAWC